MPVTARTQNLLTARKASLESGVDRANSIASSTEWELFLIEQLLFGGNSTGSPIGAPIQNASLVISAPQEGDNAAGIVDGVWHPAVGDPLFSEDPTDPNGIPLEAQSVLILTRLPIDVLVLDTDEAWELKNIAAYASVDGTAPDFSQNSTLWGFPMGGLGGKAWIDRETALSIIALSRWQPATGQALPYPNRRLIGDCLFYRNPVPLPIFEPSLIFPSTSSTDSSETADSGSAIAPIAMTFAANEIESGWVALPASSEKVMSLQIPAATGANEITFNIRSAGSSGNGLPLLDTTISLPASGGLLSADQAAALSGLAPLLDGRHEIRGAVDLASTSERIFYWINSGLDISSASATTAETALSFAASAAESSWIALPNSPSKYATVSIPAGIDAAVTELAFRARNVGDTGNGFPVLDTQIEIPVTGGYGGANVIEELTALSPLLGGQHEIKGVLNAPTPTAIEISLITPLSMATLQIRIQAVPSVSTPTLTINPIGTVGAGTAGSVTISGSSANIEDGQLVTVSIVDTTDSLQFSGTTAIAANAWSLTADLSGLAGGQTFTARANASNVAGTAAAQVTDSFLIESFDPAISISTIAGDDDLTPAEAASVAISGTTSNVEDGQTVTVAIFDDTPTQVFTDTTTVTADAWTLTADLSSLPAGSNFEVRADVSNAAAVAAPQATRAMTTEVEPTISISAVGDNVITPAEATSVAISGTTSNIEDGQTVTVAIFDDTPAQQYTNTTTVTADTWTLTADLSGLAAGSNFEVRADASRVSGTAAPQATRAITTEATPTISISTVAGNDEISFAEAATVALSGTTTNVQGGQTVTVTIFDDTPTQQYTNTATVSADAWTLTADLSGLAAGSNFEVRADVSSSLGTAATQATRSITTQPLPTIAISAIGNDIIAPAGSSAVTISGSTIDIEDAQVATITIVDSLLAQVFSDTATVSSGSWSLVADLSTLTQGSSFTIRANASSAFGTAALQAERVIYMSTLDFSALTSLPPAQASAVETAATSTAAGYVYSDQDVVDELAKVNWLELREASALDDSDQVLVSSGSVSKLRSITTGQELAFDQGLNPTKTATGVDFSGTRFLGRFIIAPYMTFAVLGSELQSAENQSYVRQSSPSTFIIDVRATASASRPRVNTTGSGISLGTFSDNNRRLVIWDFNDVSVSSRIDGTIDTEPVTAPSLQDNVSMSFFSTDSAIDRTVEASLECLMFGPNDPVDANTDLNVSLLERFISIYYGQTLTNQDPATVSLNTIPSEDIIVSGLASSVEISGSTTFVEDGQTVTVSIVDSVPTQVFSDTATVSAGAWALTADLSTALTFDGSTYTVRADATNVAGSVATQATRAITAAAPLNLAALVNLPSAQSPAVESAAQSAAATQAYSAQDVIDEIAQTNWFDLSPVSDNLQTTGSVAAAQGEEVETIRDVNSTKTATFAVGARSTKSSDGIALDAGGSEYSLQLDHGPDIVLVAAVDSVPDVTANNRVMLDVDSVGARFLARVSITTAESLAALIEGSGTTQWHFSISPRITNPPVNRIYSWIVNSTTVVGRTDGVEGTASALPGAIVTGIDGTATLFNRTDGFDHPMAGNIRGVFYAAASLDVARLERFADFYYSTNVL